MAIIANNDHEDAEWLDGDFVDLTGDYSLFIVPFIIVLLSETENACIILVVYLVYAR